ncbi:MAG: putative membrane protein [Planctomycetota bacterium]|jgi:putative membrane protein
MEWKAFGKGLCMGIADVIPGVSGGTMALILGIYARFISSIKSLNTRPIIEGFRYLASGLNSEKRSRFIDAINTVDWRFLVPLGLGIFSAMAVGSMIIPGLMDSYPEIMRGLFFGLILASVGVPWRIMPKKDKNKHSLGLIMAVGFAVFGYLVTDPNRNIDTTGTWVEISVPAGEEADLKSVIRRGPSSLNAAEVYWHDRNAELRQSHLLSDPKMAKELLARNQAAKAILKSDKKARKLQASHYEDILVQNTMVHVPRPANWFIFVAGVIAISAMVLPGISGSFLLLILGCYYFVLNAVKGTLSSLIHLEFPMAPIVAVALFASGCLTGLIGFSRILSYLLRDHPHLTFGALIGLMIGCLRGVWPWRTVNASGEVINSLPETFGGGEWIPLLALVGGAAVALGIEAIGKRTQS